MYLVNVSAVDLLKINYSDPDTYPKVKKTDILYFCQKSN